MRAPTGSAGSSLGISTSILTPHVAIGRDRLLDQRGELHALERLARRRQLGELAQDHPAALGLLAQQADVLGVARAGLDLPLELAGHHEDGGEWRAQFMGGGGGKAVELGEVMLAGENELGGDEGVRELARLLDDLPRIDADVADRDQQREPHPDHVERRQLERLLLGPGQRIVLEHEERRAGDGERRQHQRQSGRKRRGRNQHRSGEQEGERVLQPAGEVQQDRELDDIEREEPRGVLGLEPLVPAETQPQHHVYRAVDRDDGEARPERHVEIEAVMDHQHGCRLPEHGEPAQAHERVKPHAAHGVLLLLDAQIRHPGIPCN